MSQTNSKKILYLITQSELGGAQRYILDLARNLKKHYDITVAFGEQGSQGELAKLLDQSGIRYFTVPFLRRNISPLFDLLAVFRIRKLIRELKPDVVHLNSSKISILGSWAVDGWGPKNFPRPLVVYTAHGWVFNEPMSNWKKKLYRYLEIRTARLKDRIICINKLDYRVAKDELKINAKKLFMIYHGIDARRYNFLPREEARKNLFTQIKGAKEPSKKSIVVGSIGNLYATKDFLTFIQAMHYLIIDHGLPITAVIIGEGPERKILEEKIIKFHPMDFNVSDGSTENKIILAGRLPQAAELIPAFDYYVCSSVKEGFPYTLLETMTAGVPIVATRVGGIPDMLTDNQNGILVNPGDSKLIARKIAQLIKKKSFREQIRINAQSDVSRLFSFYNMLEKTKEAYEI